MSTPRTGPLSGVTVLDLSRVLAGPYCTMVLADLGARVVKVERPGSGDDARHIGPFVNGVSAYFASLNRGKDSVVLDLRSPGGRRHFERLLGGADVLVENFRPGVMDGLGYGWESVHAAHPRLIYASVSGFGQTGPLAERPAYDVIVQAMGGLMSLTGEPGRPPVRAGTSVGDITAGLFCAVGVLTALYERTSSGQGRRVDVAMLDAQVAILENALVRHQVVGSTGPLGTHHPSIAPFGAFRAADGYVVVACGNSELFARLSALLDRPQWIDDPRFVDNDRRTAHRDALVAEMERVLGDRPVEHWLQLLGHARIPCAPVNDMAAVLAEPQLRTRRMLVEVDDDRLGGLVVAGNPVKISGYPDPPVRGPVPPGPGDVR